MVVAGAQLVAEGEDGIRFSLSDGKQGHAVQ